MLNRGALGTSFEQPKSRSEMINAAFWVFIWQKEIQFQIRIIWIWTFLGMCHVLDSHVYAVQSMPCAWSRFQPHLARATRDRATTYMKDDRLKASEFVRSFQSTSINKIEGTRADDLSIQLAWNDINISYDSDIRFRDRSQIRVRNVNSKLCVEWLLINASRSREFWITLDYITKSQWSCSVRLRSSLFGSSKPFKRTSSHEGLFFWSRFLQLSHGESEDQRAKRKKSKLYCSSNSPALILLADCWSSMRAIVISDALH